MKNLELSKLFDRTADVLALQGENSFRINAYRKVARVLEELPRDVAELAGSKALEEIPGIGEGSAGRIREYLRTGHIADLEAIWKEVPAGVMDMMKIPTVGPKTAALLWQECGITTVADLLVQIDKGQLKNVPGLGEKKLEKIKQNIAFLATSTGRVRLGVALGVARDFVGFLKKQPGVIDAQYCGSLRRAKETVGDVDIAVAAHTPDAAAIAAVVTTHPDVAEVLMTGPTKTSLRTRFGLQVDVRIVPPESYGAALQYFTGSKEHNVRLREIAVRKGLKLNEWGLFKASARGDTLLAGRTEEEIYAALGLACLPPEMREDRGEIALAQELFNSNSKQHPAPQPKPPKAKAKKKAPAAPASAPAQCPSPPSPWETLQLTDLRGDLHMHTTASDGTVSIADMVAACKRRGYEYLAITDHSKSQFQANGLKADRLLDHIKAIHAVAREAARGASPILVLAGSEVDILADGSLDYEDDLLAKLDWVVASPHAALTQEADAATRRLVRACSNPHVTVIGHPTGRLIPTRRGLEPDMKAVVFAAARHGVALELNANDYRLDLRDTHLRLAVEAHVPICINTDAHAPDELDYLTLGVLYARRGWVRRADVLNARPRAAFEKWLKERREQAAW